MKGLIFTEFLDLVEDKFGYETVDHILNQSKLESDGIYTSVGTYSHMELLSLVTSLSEHSNIPVSDLVKTFAHHVFKHFTGHHGAFFQGVTLFEFIESIEEHIHVEVRKLYPDAELPTFASERSGDQLSLTYQSTRPFADLAEGLIEASILYFNETVSLSRKDLAQDGTHCQFLLSRA